MFKYLLPLFFILPQIAQAGFSLNPTYGVYKSDSNHTTSQMELRAGYKFDMGVYLGASYTLASQKLLEKSNDFYIALNVGYEISGAYALLGYILAGDQDMTSGGTKYANANGYQVTFGYRLPIFEDIFFGPELTYRKVNFGDVEIQGIRSTTDRNDTIVIPSLSVYFAF